MNIIKIFNVFTLCAIYEYYRNLWRLFFTEITKEMSLYYLQMR